MAFLSRSNKKHLLKVKDHFNSISKNRDGWLRKGRYFHGEDLRVIKEIIPSDSSVLEIGCGNGNLIGKLNVTKAVGVDVSDKLIELAKKKFPKVSFFCDDINSYSKKLLSKDKFDFILISDTVGYFYDIQESLESIHLFCKPETRIIISYFSPIWQPILSFSEKIGLKMPNLNPPLFACSDLKNFLDISGYQTIKVEKKIILPINFFSIGRLVNKFLANLPLINHLCLRQYLICRSNKFIKNNLYNSVSIIIPCKNEFGNIKGGLRRIDNFCKNMEIIFVEGNSSDNTWNEIQSVINDDEFKKKKFTIKAFKQNSTGKKNAVFTGFNKAKNEILMILDGDLTVKPEELSKFWNKISSGEAEFINGTRLIYPMERDAMRFLNYIANKLFSHLFSWILGQRYTDTLCGTKVISKKNYMRATNFTKDLQNLDPFGDFFLIFASQRLNLKMIEIPVRYEPRAYGETQISRFRDGLKLIKMFLISFFKFKAF